MKISYGILVHDETESLEKLLNSLCVERPYEYEIVIIHDNTDNCHETEEILTKYWRSDNIIIHERELNNDFATQKNYLTSKCSGDYIMNIDADELFPKYILENIHLIIEQNNTDIIIFPRINIVEGTTDEYIKRWNWQVNEKGYINFPDWQKRCYRNDLKQIYWINPVHETLTGFKTFSYLPINDLDLAEHLSILHIKNIDRQIKQNEKYDKIIYNNTI